MDVNNEMTWMKWYKGEDLRRACDEYRKLSSEENPTACKNVDSALLSDLDVPTVVFSHCMFPSGWGSSKVQFRRWRGEWTGKQQLIRPGQVMNNIPASGFHTALGRAIRTVVKIEEVFGGPPKRVGLIGMEKTNRVTALVLRSVFGDAIADIVYDCFRLDQFSLVDEKALAEYKIFPRRRRRDETDVFLFDDPPDTSFPHAHEVQNSLLVCSEEAIEHRKVLRFEPYCKEVLLLDEDPIADLVTGKLYMGAL